MDGRDNSTYHAYVHRNGDLWVLPDAPALTVTDGVLMYRDKALGPHIGEFESRPAARMGCENWLCVRKTLSS
jgi:hypothetical protein